MKRELRAFSLVEVLAAVAIIGILVFLALPNVIQAKRDTEEQMVITRAEALNMSISSFITANGRANAADLLKSKTDADKFNLVKGYMAYAPATLSLYVPSGYSFALPAWDKLDAKVAVTKADGTTVNY